MERNENNNIERPISPPPEEIQLKIYRGFLKKRIGAISVAVAAIAVRIGYLAKFRHNPFFDYYPSGFDQFNFYQGALELASGKIFEILSSEKHAALYKFFIAIPFAVFGENFWPVWILQFGLGVIASLLVYSIARRLFGPPSGIIAGLWFALYGPALFFEGQLLRESLLCFWVILSIYFLSKIRDKRRYIIFSAIALSLAMQTRPTTLLLFIGAAIYLSIWAYRDLTKRERLRPLLLFAGIFTLVSIPMLVRTILVHGSFVFYDFSGPITILLSNLPDYIGVGWEPSPLYRSFIENVAGQESELTGSMAWKYLFEIYSREPLLIFSLYFRKIYFSFFAYEYPTNLNYYLFDNLSFAMKAPWSNFAVVAAAGFAGTITSFALIRDRKEIILLYISQLALLLGIVVFYPADRFRFFLVPVFIILGSYGAISAAAFLRHKQYLKAACLAIFFVCICYALKTPADIGGKVRSLDYYNMGRAYIMNPKRRDISSAEKFMIKAWNESARRGYPENTAQNQILMIERMLAEEDIKSNRNKEAEARLEIVRIAECCPLSIIPERKP